MYLCFSFLEKSAVSMCYPQTINLSLFREVRRGEGEQQAPFFETDTRGRQTEGSS